jgi:cysteine desulfurase
MHVNNEIGVIQDIAAVASLCSERGIAFHCDAAQSAGKLPIDVSALPVDFLAFTAHKLYGPKGIGALYVRRAARPWLQPVTFGGGQENGLRPGTLATHQIAGFGAACEIAAREHRAESERVLQLRDRLWKGLEDLPGVCLNGASAQRVPGILNVSFEGVEGESLVTALTSVAVSTGSACSSATGEPSYVLRALGRNARLAESSLRFSLGRFTTEEEIDHAVEAVRFHVQRLRSVSPAWEGPVLPAPEEQGGCVEYDPLSPQVRQYFTALPGAGRLADADGRVLRGEAGGVAQDVWVRFHVRAEIGVVKEARFQALGCPHTLAAAAWLTVQLAGRHLQAGVPGGPLDWAGALSIPVEKLGRLLIVEDALQRCLQDRSR